MLFAIVIAAFIFAHKMFYRIGRGMKICSSTRVLYFYLPNIFVFNFGKTFYLLLLKFLFFFFHF